MSIDTAFYGSEFNTMTTQFYLIIDTTLEDDIIADAAALTPAKMKGLSRPGFRVAFYDTLGPAAVEFVIA